MEDYKILSYTDDLIDAYQEPIQRIDGLVRNPKEIIKTVEFYSLDQFLSGDKDELGREKPFINHGNSRVRVAKTATDIDVKDIRYEPDSLKHKVQAMLINKELYKWMKDSNFSLTLNEMGLTRPKYGGVLVKKYDDGEGLEIEVCDWVNVDFDPNDVEGGIIIETHNLDPSELVKRADVWNKYADIKDVLKAHAKANKNKPTPIEIKEVTGEFPYSFDPDLEESEENNMKYKLMCFYIAYVNKKRFLLHKEDLKERKYKYLAWEKVGNGLGRGVWEEGFQSQVWINDQYIQMKNAMDLAGKAIVVTDSKKLTGNAIVGLDTGHIVNVEQNSTANVLNLAPAALPQFQQMIEQFSNEYNRISSTFDANTGEQPPSGTPLGQTQILNQVANSPFQYQAEVWGIWLNEILNDWVYPYLKKKIIKEHNLVADFTDDELEIIDEAFATEKTNNDIAEMLFNMQPVTQEQQSMMMEQSKTDLAKKFGKKREIKIPKGFLDVEGKLTANITGELKNKQAILQSLDAILKTVVSSFNPATGTYGVLEDPTLSKVFNTMVETAGIPFSSAQLGGKPTSMQPDLTALQTQGQPEPVMAS